jgi:hypothetical protein
MKPLFQLGPAFAGWKKREPFAQFADSSPRLRTSGITVAAEIDIVRQTAYRLEYFHQAFPWKHGRGNIAVAVLVPERAQGLDEKLIDILKLSALKALLNQRLGFRPCDLDGHGASSVKTLPLSPYLLPRHSSTGLNA